MPENPEPWQIILLILPVIILMYIIRHRERKALVPDVQSLTGLQKAWLFISCLPPEHAARVLADFAPREIEATVRAASALPSAPGSLLEKVFHELSETLPGEAFKMKADVKSTLESPDFLNERSIHWLAQLIRKMWLPSAPPPVYGSDAAKLYTPLLVEFPPPLESLWYQRAEEGLEALRKKAIEERGLVLPPLVFSVHPGLGATTFRITFQGCESVERRLNAGEFPGDELAWDFFSRALLDALAAAAPTLLSNDYIAWLLAEVESFRPRLVAEVRAHYSINALRDLLKDALAKGKTMKDLVELLERALPTQTTEPACKT